jgi:hypothetical protein
MSNKDLYKLLIGLLQRESRASIYFDDFGYALSCIQVRWKSEEDNKIQSVVHLGTDNHGVSFGLMCMCDIDIRKTYYNVGALLEAIKSYKTHYCKNVR